MNSKRSFGCIGDVALAAFVWHVTRRGFCMRLKPHLRREECGMPYRNTNFSPFGVLLTS